MASKPTTPHSARLTRRRLLSVAGMAGMAALASGPATAVAAMLKRTPTQTAGPFYVPLKPLSVDNDLIQAPGARGRAVGKILYLDGRVLDVDGRPIEGARVEIWQANAFGRYTHPGADPDADDPAFQGFGHDTVGADGAYRFRTVKPAPYGSFFFTRTRHIHFAVFPPGGERWTTQMYFEGEPMNERDSLLGRVAAADRPLVVMPELPPEGAMEPDSARIRFDIVLGRPGIARKPA